MFQDIWYMMYGLWYIIFRRWTWRLTWWWWWWCCWWWWPFCWTDEIWSIEAPIKSLIFRMWQHIPISDVVSEIGWCLAGSTSLDPSVVDKISLSEMYIDDPDRDYYTLVPLGSFRLQHDGNMMLRFCGTNSEIMGFILKHAEPIFGPNTSKYSTQL